MFGELRPVPISAEPLFVSAKLVNVDDGTEKLEITFRRNGRYKKLIAPRADMLNKMLLSSTPMTAFRCPPITLES